MKLFFAFVMAFFLTVSCNTDDDICTSGEGTPRLKIKFKNKTTGNIRSLDSVFVYVNYGSGKIPVIERKQKTDSVFIPLRVEDVSFTEIFVSTSRVANAPQSKIKLNYTVKSEYVSPACGIKRLYENLNPVLETANPVLAAEKNQNEIVDESKTHIFLLF